MNRRQTISFNVARAAAELGFYVLFPGFFFYHLAVTAGLIPPMIGGLFGPVTVVLAVIFLFCLPGIMTVQRKTGRTVVLGFCLLFLYCTSWFLVHHFTTTASYKDEAAEQIVAMLASWFCLFVIGMVLPTEYRRFRWVLFVSICVMGVITLLLFDSTTMMFNPRSLYEFSDGVATYQGYARSALLSVVGLLAVCSSFGGTLLVIVPSALLLFLLGARSELFGFLALAAVLTFQGSLKSIKRLALLAVVLLGSGAYVTIHFADLMASRQSEIMDIGQATSWQARLEYQAVALRQISENPVIGSYAGHFEGGGKGAYAHNATSAWVGFGAAGFVLYVSLTAYCAAISFRRYWRADTAEPKSKLAFLVNFFAILLIIIAKPIFWTVPALGWGLAASYRGSPRTAPQSGSSPR